MSSYADGGAVDDFDADLHQAALLAVLLLLLLPMLLLVMRVGRRLVLQQLLLPVELLLPALARALPCPQVGETCEEAEDVV